MPNRRWKHLFGNNWGIVASFYKQWDDMAKHPILSTKALLAAHPNLFIKDGDLSTLSFEGETLIESCPELLAYATGEVDHPEHYDKYKEISRSLASAYSIKIHVAASPTDVKKLCKEYAWDEGICMTITQSDFIYSGGSEDGTCVGLVNYPRFPRDPKDLLQRAEDLAEFLLRRTYNRTILIDSPDSTIWLTNNTFKH